jgi:hypothetical protein
VAAAAVSCHDPATQPPYHRVVSRVLASAVLPFVLASALLVGGCGEDAPEADERPRAQQAEPTPRAQRTPARPSRSSTPKETATPTGKVAPTLPLLGRPDGSRTHLLTESVMPSLADDMVWTVRTTALESSHRVGACQKTPLVDIGALHAVRRVLRGPDDSGIRARQVVARFADAKSAWRARGVLTAWRDDCEQRLDYPTKDVGPLKDVTVDTGTGANYRARYGSKSDPAVAGLGIVRKGRWLSLVELTAPDGAYPTDRNPARRAVLRIARTFG